jgi:hypothetical protein
VNRKSLGTTGLEKREPRRLTTLWAFTVCYRDSFTFFFFCLYVGVSRIAELHKSRRIVKFHAKEGQVNHEDKAGEKVSNLHS